jgi:hypothetical protein
MRENFRAFFQLIQALNVHQVAVPPQHASKSHQFGLNLARKQSTSLVAKKSKLTLARLRESGLDSFMDEEGGAKLFLQHHRRSFIITASCCSNYCLIPLRLELFNGKQKSQCHSI